MKPYGFLLIPLLAPPFGFAQEGQQRPILALEAGGHTAAVSEVQFTPNGKRLITASHDKTVRIWDLATGESSRVLRLPVGPGREGCLFALALSPDGKTLAVGGHGTRAYSFGQIYLI